MNRNASTLSPYPCPFSVAMTFPLSKPTTLTRPCAEPTAQIDPFGATASDVIPVSEGSCSGLLGKEKMDDLKIGVEDEISQRMRVESSDVVKS